jgi:hypothetical protein
MPWSALPTPAFQALNTRHLFVPIRGLYERTHQDGVERNHDTLTVFQQLITIVTAGWVQDRNTGLKPGLEEHGRITFVLRGCGARKTVTPPLFHQQDLVETKKTKSPRRRDLALSPQLPIFVIYRITVDLN